MKWGFLSLQRVPKFDTPLDLPSVIEGEKNMAIFYIFEIINVNMKHIP